MSWGFEVPVPVVGDRLALHIALPMIHLKMSGKDGEITPNGMLFFMENEVLSSCKLYFLDKPKWAQWSQWMVSTYWSKLFSWKTSYISCRSLQENRYGIPTASTLCVLVYLKWKPPESDFETHLKFIKSLISLLKKKTTIFRMVYENTDGEMGYTGYASRHAKEPSRHPPSTSRDHRQCPGTPSYHPNVNGLV